MYICIYYHIISRHAHHQLKASHPSRSQVTPKGPLGEIMHGNFHCSWSYWLVNREVFSSKRDVHGRSGMVRDILDS